MRNNIFLVISILLLSLNIYFVAYCLFKGKVFRALMHTLVAAFVLYGFCDWLSVTHAF